MFVLGYSQEDILKDSKFQEYQKGIVAFMTSKDYLNYEKLKKNWLENGSKLSSEEEIKKAYAELKEAYDLIINEEKEFTKSRAILIEKYSQETFYKANQIINKQIFEINNPQLQKTSVENSTDVFDIYNLN